MPQRLAAQLEQFKVDLDRVTSEEALYDLQVAYLGKKGSITALKAEMGKIPPADRKAFGAAWNSARDSIDAALATRRQFLKDEARRRDLARRVDLTMPPLRPPPGTLHPLAQTRRRLSESFMRLGFDVAVGPHVESGRYNFDDLNMPSDHPARDMADTFFVSPPAGREAADAGGLDEEGVGHVAGRVVLAHVEVVEVKLLALDVRTDGDVEAEADKRLAEAAAGLGERVQAAGGGAQRRHGEVLDAGEVLVAGAGLEQIAVALEGGLDLVAAAVPGGAEVLALGGRDLAHLALERGDAALLAEVRDLQLVEGLFAGHRREGGVELFDLRGEEWRHGRCSGTGNFCD